MFYKKPFFWTIVSLLPGTFLMLLLIYMIVLLGFRFNATVTSSFTLVRIVEVLLAVTVLGLMGSVASIIVSALKKRRGEKYISLLLGSLAGIATNAIAITLLLLLASAGNMFKPPSQLEVKYPALRYGQYKTSGQKGAAEDIKCDDGNKPNVVEISSFNDPALEGAWGGTNIADCRDQYFVVEYGDGIPFGIKYGPFAE